MPSSLPGKLYMMKPALPRRDLRNGLITSLVCFVPFLVNSVAGFRSVDPNLLELARSVDARKRVVFWRLRVPSSLPFLFSAARIAVARGPTFPATCRRNTTSGP